MPPYAEMAAFLSSRDPVYRIEEDPPDVAFTPATILKGGDPLAFLEINRPGDELFEDEVDEFIAEIESVSPASKGVIEHLENTQMTLVTEIQLGFTDPTEVLKELWPFFIWIMQGSAGLLQIDGVGFYDTQSLVLELDY